MNNKIYAGVVLIFVMALGACTAGAPQRRDAKTAENPYRLEDEGTVPPLESKDIRKEADIEESAVTEPEVDVEEVKPEVDSTFIQKKTPPVKAARMEGFRVQVFASISALSAEEARNSIAGELSVPAYVEFVDGMYKVRLGDFKTRDRAEELLGRCKKAGYNDAWIVSTFVFAGSKRD